MDNFDLREYLKENKLLKENKQHFVYKTTFPNGDTFYSVSEQNPTPELFKSKTISVALNNTSKGRATTNFQNQVADLQNPKEELEVELVDTFDTKEEAITLKDESIDDDPNSINSGVNYKDKSGTKFAKKRIDPIGQELIDAGTMAMTNRYIIIPTSAHNQEQSKYFQNLNPARAKEFGNYGVVSPLKTKSKEHKLLTRNDWRVLAQKSPGFVVYDFQQLQGIIDGLQTK